jgi:NAD(P)H-hydrate repair Nnr-like enzyme with NAD(P)H-hydrate dehydratase domain
LQADAEKTVCFAVWQHGAAADWLTATRKNWAVEDLADEIGDVRKCRAEKAMGKGDGMA